MSNIRIDLEATVINGQTLTFKSPVDCSQITGLKVYYPEGDAVKSRVFQFADAHGNNVGNINLFAANVLVKVILDTDLSRAYVQNADTNAYLESHIQNKNNPHGMTAEQIGAASKDDLKAVMDTVNTAQERADSAYQIGVNAQASANTAQYTADNALPKAGGDIRGYIDFKNTSMGLSWETADGTIINLRPYSPSNLFQLTMQNPAKGVGEYGVINIHSDGRIEFNNPAQVRTNIDAAQSFHSAPTVLSGHQYGDTLPNAGTPGRIFFKKVT